MINHFSTPEFETLYTYEGNDLGATWSKQHTTFRLWAPTARWVKVCLYRSGDPWANDRIRRLSMKPDKNGTWVVTVKGDLNGVYYTYQVSRNHRIVEACDPYARTTGVNGQRAMVVDLSATNPEGWEQDRDPHDGIRFTDVVIAEAHIRDFSIHPSGNIPHAGKYLGICQSGCTTDSGIPTGIDHYKNLGITHLHLLPMYDFGSVDEAHLEYPQYNWGYDPVNYNVPEGSYSTDPFHGEVRVRELKQMVKGLHDNGISVIMDVVYNHVYQTTDFCFNKLVPNYFSRVNEKGKFANGSYCGNDTASERSMVRKYIVDSLCYWADEYHIDGFRFDLVGLIDTQTITEAMHRIRKTHPNVLFYGEGWTMPTEVTKPGITLTTQPNAAMVPEFAFFNDTIRDALRGSTMNRSVPGFVSGARMDKNLMHNCFMGVPFWATHPNQSINYVSCHDNNTLIDRLAISAPNVSREQLVRMNNLAAAFSITAEGIPFFMAGEEMLRTKPDGKGGFVENSYNSPDSVNAIRWDALNDPERQKVYRYYQGLLAFRKAHKKLRLSKREQVLEKVTPIHLDNPHAVAFGIGRIGDTQEILIFNAGLRAQEVALPQGKWGICVNADTAGTAVLEEVANTVTVEPVSACMLVRVK